MIDLNSLSGQKSGMINTLTAWENVERFIASQQITPG